MPKLELRFGNSVLADYGVGVHPLTFGRGPDCDVVIDNLAVSTHHATLFLENGQYVLEDNHSLNGTMVNNIKVDRCLLREGDVITIGKHSLAFYEYAESATPPKQRIRPVPKLDGTVVLQTKQRLELLKSPVEAQSVAHRVSIAHLRVLGGKTDQAEYVLTSQLTIIGKSEMATVKLRGWFKPETAGVIMRKGDGYHVGPASNKVTVRVNGAPVRAPQLIHDGDVIEVPGAKLLFQISQ